MNRDRNLLFGVFAVQLGKVAPARLMEAAAAWATDPTHDLPSRLLELGAFSAKDKSLLLGLVEQAIAAHAGDAAATLAAFGGTEQVHHSFHGSIVLAGSEGVEARAREGAPDGATVPGVQEAPGRYSQISEHARGGMGRVLLVHDEHLGRDIALKELLPELTPSSGSDAPSPVRLSVPFMARFLQEARITGQLEHPSIVPVYELGYRGDGTLYYTMKLVRGQTLARALREAGGLNKRLELLPHFVNLCNALAYAHSRGVIHRDIKPGNVMVGEFGETVVIDWGLAKVKGRKDVHPDPLGETLHVMRLGSETDAVHTEHGQALGTPAYMPPEQVLGEIQAVDERSDVYSLGAVLYELLTGTPPHEGKSVAEILDRVIKDAPTPASRIEPTAPPELIAICERALQKDSSARYQTAKELAEDVQRFLSGALVHAYEYGFKEHLKRFAAQHKTILTTVAAFLLVFIGLAAFYNVSLIESRNRERDLRVTAEHARRKAEEAQNNERDWRAQFFNREAEVLDKNLQGLKSELAKENPEGNTKKVAVAVLSQDNASPGAAGHEIATHLCKILGEIPGLEPSVLEPSSDGITANDLRAARKEGAAAQRILQRLACDSLLVCEIQKRDQFLEVSGTLTGSATARMATNYSVRWDLSLPNYARNIAKGLVYGVLATRPVPQELLAAADKENAFRSGSHPAGTDRPTIAVLPFRDDRTEQCRNGKGNVLPDQVRAGIESALWNTRRFDVLERARLNEVLAEQKVALSKGDPKGIFQIGDPAPASFLVFGWIACVSDGSQVTLSVLDSREKAEITEVSAHISNHDDEVESALRTALASLAQEVLAAFPRISGKVSSATGRTITVDFGRIKGIRKGMVLIVSTTEPPVTDAVTGKILAQGEPHIVAQARVATVDEESVIAEILPTPTPEKVTPGMDARTW